jgi:hypothetical protein
LVPDTLHDIDFMVKDSKRFSNTGGWGFAQFNDEAATDIFIGKVARRDSRWVDTPWGAVIFTYVTFDIEESLKGPARGQTTLQFRGGTVGDVTLHIADMPEFQMGDRDLLFVGDRTAVSPLVGFMHGRFRIQHDASGNVDRVRTHDGRLVSTSALGRSTSRNRCGCSARRIACDCCWLLCDSRSKSCAFDVAAAPTWIPAPRPRARPRHRLPAADVVVLLLPGFQMA